MKYAAGFTMIVVVAAAAAGVAFASRQAVTQGPELRRGQEVPICHATRLKSQPYVSLSPDVDGVLSGHDGHADDIIPPFEYEPQPGSGESGSYPGKNWDAEGRQIWAFDCDPSAVRDVTPTVECVEDRPNGFVAHFGYRNSESSAVNIEVGNGNMFAPAPENRGQPTVFQPGTHGIQPVEPFSGSLTWNLAGRSATASSASVRCQASIRIDKALKPENDAGPLRPPAERRSARHPRRERRYHGHAQHRRDTKRHAVHGRRARLDGNDARRLRDDDRLP